MTGAADSARPLPKPVKALVLGLISALAALAALEVAVRVLRLDASPEDALRWHPRFGWTLNPANQARDGVDDLGFRHPPVPIAKPAGVRRLVILGDSFAQGTAYPYRATFAGLLGEWLGERWQVINLGVSGWGTAQEYLALRDLGMAYEPDAVVLQTLPFNDVCNNALALAHLCDTEDSYRPYFVIERPVLDDGGRLRLTWDQPWRARLRRSALFRLLERRVPALAPPAPAAAGEGEDAEARSRAVVEFHRRHAEAAGVEHRIGLYTLLPDERQPPAVEEAWAVTERLVGEIAGLTEAAGVPLIAMAIPYADSFDPDWRRRAGRPGHWPRSPERLDLDPALGTARMERVLAARGAAVIPVYRGLLEGPMTPADHFYPFGKAYDRHLDRLGHWQVAKWIVDELNRLGLTSARPPEAAIERADLLAGAGWPVAERGFDRPRRTAGGSRGAGFGPESRLVFPAAAAVPMRLRVAARPRGATEAIELIANGTTVGILELAKGATAAAEIPFTAVPGRNEVRLVYRGWRPDGGRAAVEIAELVLETTDRRNSSIAAVTASGCSSADRWPAPGTSTSLEPDSPRASTREWIGGREASSSPTTISAGTVISGSRGTTSSRSWSARNILRIEGRWTRLNRSLHSATRSGRCRRVVDPNIRRSTWGRTGRSPTVLAILPSAEYLKRFHALSGPASVSRRIRASTRCGTTRAARSATMPPIDRPAQMARLTSR